MLLIKRLKSNLLILRDVYFDVSDGIDNNFFIMRNEHFQFSELAQLDNLHMCLDNVYYPLTSKSLVLIE